MIEYIMLILMMIVIIQYYFVMDIMQGTFYTVFLLLMRKLKSISMAISLHMYHIM